MSGLHAFFLKFSCFLYHLIFLCACDFQFLLYHPEYNISASAAMGKCSGGDKMVQSTSLETFFFSPISYLLPTLQICSLQTFMALINYKIQKSRTLNSVLTCHSQLCRVVFHLFMVSYDNGFPQPAQWLTN